MSPSFSSPPVVVGLDIGTTKICALVAGEGEPGATGAGTEGTLRILGVGIVPSQGVRRGVVVDVPDTVAAIKEAVARAGHMAGVEIEGVVAGVTGDHIISENRTGSVTVASRGNQVSSFDVDRALSAALIEVGRDREIIHSLPRSWSVDEERGIKKPLGFVGTRLEVETHVVTGQSAVIRNTFSCLSGAGVRADGLILEPLASAEAVTTRDEREMGALVLDIGGGTTDLAAYYEGSIIYSAALPVGGNHVTRDVSIGLSTPFEFAEKLKVGSGAATRDMIPHGEALEVFSAGGASRLRIPRALLGEIIEARMRELFELSLAMTMSGGLKGLVPGGIILSGGGALLPGSVELAEKIFGLPVRLGVPVGLSGWSDAVSSPQFSTSVGLCRVALAQKTAPRSKAPGPIALPNARRVWGNLTPGITMVRPLNPTPSAPETAVPETTTPAPIATPSTVAILAHEEFPALLNFAPATENVPIEKTVVPEAAPVPVSTPVAVFPVTAPDEPQPEVADASPEKSELAVQRARLGDLLPRINATRADVSRAKGEVAPETAQEESSETEEKTPEAGEEAAFDQNEKPTLWHRFLVLIGFAE